MGSFPHELPGYRHVSDTATREMFERDWGVEIQSEPGLRIPRMLDAALDGSFLEKDDSLTNAERRFPLLLTTGRVLSQYNVGVQTRRTANTDFYGADLLEIHPHDAEERDIRDGDRVGIESRAGKTVLPATLTERVQPGVVYTTFHFPESGANVITTDNSDWATNCPEYKVTAVQVSRLART